MADRCATFAAALLVLSCAQAHLDHSTGNARCPGSPASFHAWVVMEASLSVSCLAAREEVLARVAGQANKTWDDPHGDGLYRLLSYDAENITVDRRSSNAKYTDKVSFRFIQGVDAASCKVLACSESQSASGVDQSTNLCNGWNLVCGKSQQCCSVLHEITSFSYRVLAKSSYAGESVAVCLGGQGGSGGGFGGEKQTSCPGTGVQQVGSTTIAGAKVSTTNAGSKDTVTVVTSSGLANTGQLVTQFVWLFWSLYF